MRVVLFILMFLVALPTIAQEETPPAPFTDDDILMRQLPEPNPDIELSQTVSLYNDSMTLKIPTTWGLDMRRKIIFSDEALMDTISEDADYVFLTDDVLINIISFGRMDFDEVTPMVIADGLRDITDSATVTVYDYEDAPTPTYYMTFVGDDIPAGAFFLMQNPPDSDYWVFFLGVAGDYDAQEALILAILETVVYTPIEMTPFSP